MTAEIRVRNNCVRLLEQAVQVLNGIDDAIYVSTSAVSSHGSIGGHIRHILDFYQSFLNGVASGLINYRMRQRESRLEVDRLAALTRITTTISALESLSRVQGNNSLLVSTEDGYSSEDMWCQSSLMRELEFLQSHTVHHYSLVAMLLRLHEIQPDEEFGVAPSTLRYWREKEAACAQ